VNYASKYDISTPRIKLLEFSYIKTN